MRTRWEVALVVLALVVAPAVVFGAAGGGGSAPPALNPIAVARSAMAALHHPATTCASNGGGSVSCRDRAGEVWTIQVSGGWAWTASRGQLYVLGRTASSTAGAGRESG
jgi:hypothetical protein